VRTPHPLHWSVVGVVAVGGALGAVVRYAATLRFPDASLGFPWTIFTVNVLGCFLLALLPTLESVRRHPLLPPLLGTGVLGGFTTLSTYSEQSRALATAGRTGLAATYVVGTLAAALLAVLIADRFSTPVARTEFDEEEGDL
jgi:fluoride exporter